MREQRSADDPLTHSADPYIITYIQIGLEERALMATKKTRIFMSGNSQAVRIPREFQLDGDEVEIQQRGNTLVIRPKKLSWAPLMGSLKKFTADFMAQGRRQPAIQRRKRPFA